MQTEIQTCYKKTTLKKKLTLNMQKMKFFFFFSRIFDKNEGIKRKPDRESLHCQKGIDKKRKVWSLTKIETTTTLGEGR